jgi:hypothetical protein
MATLSRPKRIAVLLTAAMFVLASSVQAQDRRSAFNAAQQAQLKQRGTVGGGYRPYSAWTYQNTARNHAQALYTYGEECERVDPATAREHLTEIKRNVEMAQTELEKIGEEATTQGKLEERIAALRKRYEACAEACGMIETTIGEDGVEKEPLCSHCNSLKKELDGAEAEFKALMKELGIEVPVVSKQEKPAAAAEKE